MADTPELQARRRLTAQALCGPRPRSAEAAVRRLLAVQAQDLRAVRLALRARSPMERARDLDPCLERGGDLVLGWLDRGTLHLVAREDLAWLRSLVAPRMRSGVMRRLEREGVGEAQSERAVTHMQRRLAGGPMRRRDLAADLTQAGVDCGGQRMVFLLALGELTGRICRGPVRGPEQAWVAAGDGWDPAPVPDRDTALAELGRRYLAGHGPATPADLAWWSGLSLGDSRRAISLLAAELTPGAGELVALRRPGAAAAPPVARLRWGHSIRSWSAGVLGSRGSARTLTPSDVRG